MWRTAGTVTCALLLLGMAGALLAHVGLPQRADYSGLGRHNRLHIAAEVGAYAPPFALARLQGGILRSSALAGRATLLNFWASACTACRQELPLLQEWQETAGDALRIVAINLGDRQSVAQAWAAELGLTFDIVLDPRQTLASLYRLPGLPTTFLLDERGIVRQVLYGQLRQAQLRDMLHLLRIRTVP